MTRVDRLLGRLGQASSASLKREFQSPGGLTPRLTLSKAAAYALSLVVYGLGIGSLIAGILLAFNGGLAGIIIGLPLIGLAWLARPRFAARPPDMLAPEEMPRLRAFGNAVANAVGTRPPDLLRVAPEFGAFVTQVGLRRNRVLSVGTALFAMLTAQERIAVIGHELAHFSNGDPRRGLITGTALMTLIEWHLALVPRSLADVEDEGVPGLLMMPLNVLMFALSMIPLALATLLVTLIERESQRAEYLADAEAARIAGTDALISAWDKLHLGSTAAAVAASSTDEYWKNRSFWDELELRASEFPERELERARRIDRATAARLDLTHPPTTSRIEVVSTRPQHEPTLRISPDEAAALDEELRSASAAKQAHLIDSHHDALDRASIW